MVKAGKILPEDDAKWFHSYESARETERNRGASARRAHTVESTYRESSEEAAAVGEGVSAAEAAQVAAMVKAEGERTDYLARIGMESLKASADLCRELAKTVAESCRSSLDAMTKRQETLEGAHVKLLAAWRFMMVQSAKDEAAAIVAEAEADAEASKGEDDGLGGLTKLAEQLAPILGPLMGIDLSGMGNGKAKGKNG